MRLSRFLNESARSDKHEKDIAKAFKNQSLPDNLPRWMLDYGFVPEAKVVKSTQTGGTGIKPDVIVQFDKGPSLRISAKMSNADYFGNWYSQEKVAQDLGEEMVKPLIEETVKFANKYRGRGDPFVGVSISFGKRSGETGKNFTELFPLNLITRIVAGGNPNAEVNANSLYTTTEIPNSIEGLLNNLKPISDSVIRQLSKNFSIVFRPVYVRTNKSNLTKPAWSQLEPNAPLREPTLFETQEELLRVTHWSPVPLNSRVSHNSIVKDLKKSNILVINK